MARSKSFRGPRRLFLPVLLIGLSFTLMVLPRGLQSAARLPFLALLSPIQSPVARAVHRSRDSWQALSRTFRHSGEVEKLRLEIRRLQEELALQSVRTDRLRRILARQADLLGLAAVTDQIGRKIVADVVATYLGGPSGTVVINRGTAHGVRPEMVAVSGRLVVGRVIASAPHASQIRLLTSPQCRLPVYLPRTGESGWVEGLRGPRLRLRLNNVWEKPVQPGDLILTSGARNKIPRNLLVGRIVEARGKRGLYYDARVEPFLDPAGVQAVFILERKTGDAERLAEPPASGSR